MPKSKPIADARVYIAGRTLETVPRPDGNISLQIMDSEEHGPIAEFELNAEGRAELIAQLQAMDADGYWMARPTTGTWVRATPPPPMEDSEAECEGHESLAGEHMGEAVFCDGSCRTPKATVRRYTVVYDSLLRSRRYSVRDGFTGKLVASDINTASEANRCALAWNNR